MFLCLFFGDQPSGFIVFLRVFRVRSELTDDLLAKGRMGSSQIFQLYDNQTATSVPADILEPVISDNKFEYVKEEIVYLLKKEECENPSFLISILKQNIILL